MLCYCGSGQLLLQCCEIIQQQGGSLLSAEQLMRARYSAYVIGNLDFLRVSTLPMQQDRLDIQAMQRWSAETTWLGLQVLSHQLAAHSERHAWVSFEIRACEQQQEYVCHERSAFVKDATSWRFIDPTVPIKAERNQLCVCGSGIKFKKCCAPML